MRQPLVVALSAMLGWLMLQSPFATGAEAAPPKRTFRAGASRVDITPERFPVIVNAMFEERSADKVTDRLHARCLVLDDGETRIAVVVVDSCMLPRDLIDRAKKRASEETGIPTGRMLISATHTHSAPSAMGCLGSRVDADYAAWLPDRIANAIIEASRRLAPARIGWAVTDDWDHTFNRRWIRRPDRMLTDPFGVRNVRANMHPGYESSDIVGPSGPVDSALSILAVETLRKRPIALLANYSQHYYGSPLLSSDYYGRFAESIATRLGADEHFVGMMSQGTSGDLMWMDYGAPPNDIGYAAYAQAIAERTRDAYQRIAWQEWVPLQMAERTITLGLRVPAPARLTWARETASKLGDRLPHTQAEIYALEAIHLDSRRTAELKLQAIRVGALGITAIPNEVFAISGLKIKGQSPLRPTFNIELANGAEGYIPPPEQHQLGGYTTWPARTAGLVVEAEPRIVETVLSLLEEVSSLPRKELPETEGPFTNAVLAARPVAFWRLNDAGGPIARDSSGHNHHGTFEDGIAFWLPGADGRIGFHPARPETPNAFCGDQINRAPHFAGGRLKATVPGIARVYSVELWLWNGLPDNARPVTGYFLSHGPNAEADCPGDHVAIGGTSEQGSAGHLLFFNGNERNRLLAGHTRLPWRQWHHVVFVRDGAKVTVWLNGNPSPEIRGECDSTVPPGEVPFFFGGRSDGFANFEGRLDEVALYDRALTEEEVTTRYRASGFAPASASGNPSNDAAPLSAQESLGKLHVRDGFRVELVAAEPLVIDPVAIDWDAAGRLWVAEMADYPLGIDNKGAPGGRIRVLEDTDGDGLYERATLFADGLQMPNGLLAWRDGVLVTTAPEIVFLKDTNGDGRADSREVLYSGFLVGNPQLRVNGLRWGLDNWIYCAAGGHHGNYGVNTKIRSTRSGAELLVGSRDLRIRPDIGALEAASGPSQFGRNRDAWGHWFGTQNSWPLWHYVLPDHYLRRNPHVPASDPVVQVVTPKNPKVFPASAAEKRYHSFEEAGHFTSACSGMLYGDDVLFGPGPISHAFACEPFHNLIHHEEVFDDGVSFRAQRPLAEKNSEFLASEDRWFRPVMTRTGPDGALWVVDMYRYMIEHPEWLPPEGRAELLPRYRLGDDRGRIYRVLPTGASSHKSVHLDRLHSAELVAALDSSNAWQRDKIQQLLIWKEDLSVVPPLETMVRENANPLARLQALCTLDGLNRLRPEIVEAALHDVDPGVRENALRLAERCGTTRVIAAAAKLVSDPSQKVRLQFAFSAGEWTDPAAGDALNKLALAHFNDAHLTAAILSSALPHYRGLADAAARAGGDVFHRFFQALFNVSLALSDRQTMALLIAPLLRQEKEAPSAAEMEALIGFFDAMARHKTSVAALGQGDDELSQAMRSLARVFDGADKILKDETRLPAERIAAATLLVRDAAHREETMRRIAVWLSPRAAPNVQQAAIRILSATGDQSVPALLFGAWHSLTPEARTAVLEQMLAREKWTLEMLTRVENGEVAPAAFDAIRRTRLAKHPSREVRDAAARALPNKPTPNRAKVVEEFRAALSLRGDPARARELFQQRCASCHRRGEIGNDIGPDLRSVLAHEPERLLAAILDPSADVQPGYHAYHGRLANGEEIYGIIGGETATTLAFKLADGTSRQVLRQDIDALENTNRSFMPEGLESGLTAQDMANLIALLRTP